MSETTYVPTAADVLAAVDTAVSECSRQASLAVGDRGVELDTYVRCLQGFRAYLRSRDFLADCARRLAERSVLPSAVKTPPGFSR